MPRVLAMGDSERRRWGGKIHRVLPSFFFGFGCTLDKFRLTLGILSRRDFTRGHYAWGQFALIGRVRLVTVHDAVKGIRESGQFLAVFMCVPHRASYMI